MTAVKEQQYKAKTAFTYQALFRRQSYIQDRDFMNSSFTTKYGEIEHPNRPSQCQHYEMVDYQKANNFQTCSQ